MSHARTSSTEDLAALQRSTYRLWINPLGSTPFYADNPFFSFLVQWNLTWVITLLIAYLTRSIIITLAVAIITIIVVRDTRRIWVQRSSKDEVEEGRRTFREFRQTVLRRIGESVQNIRISRGERLIEESPKLSKFQPHRNAPLPPPQQRANVTPVENVAARSPQPKTSSKYPDPILSPTHTEATSAQPLSCFPILPG